MENMATAFNGLGLWRGQQPVWGKRMHARTFDRSLYLWMHRCGLMGKSERATLMELIKPGMNIVDVGANVGLYTLFMAGLAGPGGRVTAFEPDPDNVEILRENCSENGAGNVDIRHCALGAEAGRLSLHRLILNSGENHLGRQERSAFSSTMDVDVQAFDTLFPSARLDFVKVDVQGWELKVLSGMEAALRRSKPVIFLEFWPDGLMRAGAEPEDLYQFIEGIGLNLYSCDGWGLLTLGGFLELATTAKGMGYVNLVASVNRPGPVGREG
ncbi:MAG TPA: FkbM family methyltransferase [Opitutaceae bacterium]|nr:FkbM family methyltransferase [Opitutaceae bacterium]